METHSVAVCDGKILEENLAHELSLVVTRNSEHVGRKVPLKRGEDRRAEIQLKVIVTVWFVLLVRVQSQPLARRRCRRRVHRRGDGAVSVGGVTRRRHLRIEEG